MAVKSSDLSWIVVSDLDKAVRFFTEVVGLKLMTREDSYGWAELSCPDGGTQLGIALAGKENNVKPGQNAIMTFTVGDLVKAKNEMAKKGTKMVGDVLEVPGHVKLQFFNDHDGNLFQLVEQL
ncbi:MAG: VOC family protein [Parachlamydia sp.]|nr:VOC family protein [Parachlamydia sp.]